MTSIKKDSVTSELINTCQLKAWIYNKLPELYYSVIWAYSSEQSDVASTNKVQNLPPGLWNLPFLQIGSGLQTYHVYSTLRRGGTVVSTSFQHGIHVVWLSEFRLSCWIQQCKNIIQMRAVNFMYATSVQYHVHVSSSSCWFCGI